MIFSHLLTFGEAVLLFALYIAGLFLYHAIVKWQAEKMLERYMAVHDELEKHKDEYEWVSIRVHKGKIELKRKK